MTQISLRAYIREIDNLIERELLDEAIAHCRHILQTYPKNIETYRLLGKSYLEAKRYGDAADIFQRVLSAVPDDFVSHIGMAIVREDEGNLDSAIWHMERAFETNPANPAIQQELRRLIGRRDGLEPNKVRLTRGALARMYANGELYPQAIAELQSALQEDPDRPDLQVLLADMLWQTDQKMEAADVSRQILEKLPYCQKAGRIMAAVHQEQGKSDEGTAYHRRLAQLDPYAAYLEYPMVDTVKVEADTIQMERLDWHPGQPLPASESAQPDWAASLGVEIESDEGQIDTGGPLPSWLDDIQPGSESLEIEDGTDDAAPRTSPFETPSFEDESEQAAPPTEEPPDEAPPEEAPSEMASPEETPSDAAPEEGIPNWMTDAGWAPSTGEAVETPVSFSDSELSSLEHGELPADEPSIEAAGEQEEGDLAPAEIPSWLQDRAPGPDSAPVAPPAGDETPDEGGEGAPDWLEEIAEPEVPTAEAAPGEPADQGLMPDWLGEMADEAEAGDMDAELPTFELPEDAQPADMAAEPSEAGEQGDVPAWLDDSEPGATSTILTWLGNREDQEGEAEPEAAGEAEPADVPEWMQAAMEDEGEAEGEPEAEPEPSEGPPAWLSGVAQAAAASEEAELDELAELRAQAEPVDQDESIPQESEAEPGEIPAWLMAIRDEEAGGESGVEEFDAELPESFPWEAEDQEPDVAPAEADMDIEEAPELLDAFPEPSAPSPEPGPSEITPPGDDLDASSWLESLSEETDEAWSTEAEETVDEDAASATSWLENLGQSEEEPTVSEAAPAAEEPDWMKGLDDEEAGDEAMGDLASTWLEGLADTLAETPAEPEAVASEADDDDVPNWLLDYEAPEIEEPSIETPEPETPEPEPTESEVPLPPPAEAEEDTGRLQLLEELGLPDAEDSEETIPVPSSEATGDSDVGQLEGMDDDQIFEWLEGLAARDTEGAEVDEPGAPTPPPAMESEPETELVEQPSKEADLGWLEQLAEQRGISSEIEAASIETLRQPQEPQPEPEAAAVAPPSEPVEPPAEAEDEAPATVEAPRAASEDEAPTAGVTPHPEPAEEAPATISMTPAEEPTEEAPATIPMAPAEEPSGAATEGEAEEAPPAEPPDWLIAATEAAQPEAPEPTPDSTTLATGIEAEPERETEPEPEAPPEPTPVLESEPAETAVSESETPSDLPEPEPMSPVEPEMEPASPTADSEMEAARQALASGKAETAAEEYGRLIKDRHDLPSVIEDLEAAVERDPESSVLWQVLGDAYMKADRSSDAVKAYNRGMKEAEVLNSARQALASGDPARAAAQYGILIKGKKKLDDVIEDLENAVAQEDDQPLIWQTLGDAYMKADRLEDSIEAYRKGMSSV